MIGTIIRPQSNQLLIAKCTLLLYIIVMFIQELFHALAF